MRMFLKILRRLSEDLKHNANGIRDYTHADLLDNPKWILESGLFRVSIPASRASCPVCHKPNQQFWTDPFGVPNVECDDCGIHVIDKGETWLYRLNPSVVAVTLQDLLNGHEPICEQQGGVFSLGQCEIDDGVEPLVYFSVAPDSKTVRKLIPDSCLICVVPPEDGNSAIATVGLADILFDDGGMPVVAANEITVRVRALSRTPPTQRARAKEIPTDVFTGMIFESIDRIAQNCNAEYYARLNNGEPESELGEYFKAPDATDIAKEMSENCEECKKAKTTLKSLVRRTQSVIKSGKKALKKALGRDTSSMKCRIAFKLEHWANTVSSYDGKHLARPGVGAIDYKSNDQAQGHSRKKNLIHSPEDNASRERTARNYGLGSSSDLQDD